MPLITNIIAKILARETVAGDVEDSVSEFRDRDPVQLANGTGASQADRKFSDTRTTTGTTGETLDLNALTDSLGRTINFAKTKAIRISASPLNVDNVVVGNAAGTQHVAGFGAATHTWAIPPGGVFMVAATVNGWSSANGAADLLKIASSAAGAVTYDIEIVGTSA